MNVLERRIKVTELTDFEQLLKKLHEIDLSLLGVVKKLETQSEIVTHKYVFCKVLIKFHFKKNFSIPKKIPNYFVFCLWIFVYFLTNNNF